MGAHAAAGGDRENPGMGKEEYSQRGYRGFGNDDEHLGSVRYCGAAGGLGVGNECCHMPFMLLCDSRFT